MTEWDEINCPRCGTPTSDFEKLWKYRSFVVIQYRCNACAKSFNAYFRDAKLSHTIPMRLDEATKKIRKSVSFLTNSGRKIEHHTYVRADKSIKHVDATCSICGLPKRCYRVELQEPDQETWFYGAYICRACLERLRDFLADIEVEEDAKGFEEGIKEASKIFKGEDAR